MISPISRRNWLSTVGCGFGSLALAGLASRASTGASPHPVPRAKRIIFLFMQGGVSHVDSFDYKPALLSGDGKAVTVEDSRTVAKTGKRDSKFRLMKPLWDYKQHGESGKWGSELFPEMNKHVDKFCFIHSMHTEGVAHGPATLFLHCGSTNFVRPSMGSWMLYGLGSENQNLPGFISIAPSSGNGGARNYGSAFLPSIYQGTPLGQAGAPAAQARIRNLGNKLASSEQTSRFELLQELQAEQLKRRPGDAELEAVAESYELAWRMQQNAPDILDINRESKATKDLYGIGEKETDNFGQQCLMARRLSESGVRYIQVTYGDNSANPAWDQHSNMPKHKDHARKVDKPIAGLLADLDARGLLEDTIVWWSGEFGRTPYAQDNGTGRDHNPTGFTTWLAGGGFKPSFAYGETDEFGHKAVVDKVHMHDLHATLLYQMGLDHEKLTFKYSGRDFRLTDVHGRVVHEVLT